MSLTDEQRAALHKVLALTRDDEMDCDTFAANVAEESSGVATTVSV